MAIVKMNKFSLFSFKTKKEILLDALHKFGKVQFINLQDKNTEDLEFFQKDSEKIKLSEIEENLAKLKFSLDFIEKYIDKEGTIEALKKGKSTISYERLIEVGTSETWREYYSSLKEKEKSLNEIKNEYTKLNSEVEVLKPWLNLDTRIIDLKGMKTSLYFIGSIPKAAKESFIEEFNSKVESSYIEVISEVKADLNLLVIVHKEEKEAESILKSFGFNSITLNYEDVPCKIVESLNVRKEEILKEEENIKGSIKEFKGQYEELKIAYEYYSTLEDKAEASENFLKSKNVVAIEGWVPTKEVSNLEREIKEVVGEDYYFTTEGAEVDDSEVPVLLKNNKLVSAFESITEMYSLPRYNEIDPTPLLTPFYLVFFGMMLADIGYGLLMLLGTIFALKAFNLDDKQKSFVKFFLFLSIPTMIAGAVYGSFFGGIINLPKLVDPGEDVIVILIASIILGVVQIFAGLGIKAYMLIREKDYVGALFDVGAWYASLIGAFLFLGAGAIGLSQTVSTIGKWIMIIGMATIVLTHGRENKSVGAKLGAGLYSLYGISGYVGDLVSYSRLMALGLAGGFIGSAFNIMVGMLGNGVAKWIFAPLIFVAGHIFNLLLSALGAYVHTARLQYVEYFGKFYEGGGKAFKPFKSKNKFINIKNK
ncbi:V-type ATP synthase subunit I [Hathewaya histolytica]|uniref:V-type ATP synthase subunit I n=1 Tax=Hathewaya histolytica TaxID=1498 RepID=A0A4U9RAC4_HATHI|nr:V-type ATP synthase subunit I [Hathewaya histolytica]VTQ87153.1 V-type ATP synthase subunit I [Hathewaya histolytica]